MYFFFIDLAIPKIVWNIVFLVFLFSFAAAFYFLRRIEFSFFLAFQISIDTIGFWLILNNSLLKDLLPDL
jgi:hypothetical protein